MVLLWWWYWRRGGAGGRPFGPSNRTCRSRMRCCSGAPRSACLLFVAGILAGVADRIAGDGRGRPGHRRLRGARPEIAAPSLVPWRLLVFVTGLFLVVPTLMRHGLDTVMGSLIGTGRGRSGGGSRGRRGSRPCPMWSTICPPTWPARRSVPRRQSRPVAGPVGRNQRRLAGHTVGLAGHADLVRALPPPGRPGAAGQIHADRRGSRDLPVAFGGMGAVAELNFARGKMSHSSRLRPCQVFRFTTRCFCRVRT